MSKDKEPPKPPKTWVEKVSGPKKAPNENNKISKGRSRGEIEAASSVTPSSNLKRPKKIKTPPKSWVEKVAPEKKSPAKKVLKKPTPVKAPTTKKQAAKAPTNKVLRPPGGKVSTTPVKRPPTVVKKAPKISRGPKR